MPPPHRLTTHDEALLAVGHLCEALAGQDVDPHVRWELVVDIPAGSIALDIALDKPVTVAERDLMLQAASRIASLARQER